MTADSGAKALRRLVEHPLRIPQHLRGVADSLTDLGEPLGEVVTEFIRKPVEVSLPLLARIMSPVPQEDGSRSFDCHVVDGAPAMRLILSPEEGATLARQLFARDMDEPVLLTSITQGFASRMAMALIMESGAAYQPPKLIKSPATPLSDLPVLKIEYGFAIPDGSRVSMTVELARPFTDSIARPPTRVPQSTIDQTPFPIVAVLADQMMRLAALDDLQPGSVIQLDEASVEKVDLRAITPFNSTSLAKGVMGAEKGIRSIQIRGEGSIDTAAMQPPASEAESADDDFDLGIDMNFAQPALG
ncbi:FliM/FliN family flagellar motor switch protein [Parvularcula sp. LCG005]|uniref:FliM/FliN family flagellar motor switch protein n=1 Tax=Parvularcula sp. LCG005 TaxID=3078805 RepID=UPI002941D985|nr:FliM/FliN family flagellar motor switch protein [Parvularcula sp. LCG005]WOI52706.1 FliM/FliN family flagellar motor switch protein [Parvularcula sp. LCG005]